MHICDFANMYLEKRLFILFYLVVIYPYIFNSFIKKNFISDILDHNASLHCPGTRNQAILIQLDLFTHSFECFI